MHPWLRYFYAGSYVVLIAVTLLVGTYFRSYVEKDVILPLAEQHNAAAKESFTKLIWNKHWPTIAQLPCSAPQSCPNLSSLQRDLDQFFGNLSLLKYEMYFDDGTGILTNEKFFSDGEDSKSNIGFITARDGEVHSDLMFGYESNGQTYNVVRTFLPIIPDETRRNRIPGVVVFYYNLSPFWSNVGVTQTVIIVFMVVLFSVIFGSMYFSSVKIDQALTKQYEATADLMSAKASAEKESEEKSRFLANISHELRTPLNAIIGFSEIIRDEVMGPLNNQQYKEYVNDIHSSGVHLLSLINDILDYSKAEAGKLEIQLAETDITKIMKNCLRLVSPRAKDAGVKLVEEIPAEHYVLKVDGKRLKQVLLNLLSNAVKFTPSGGTVTMFAWNNLADGKFIVEVQDTGVGIAPKDISKVMSRFGQVENDLGRRYEGTGLGLPLSKKLVELMGGRMEIKSTLGEGTVVSIILPTEAHFSDEKSQKTREETALPPTPVAK